MDQLRFATNPALSIAATNGGWSNAGGDNSVAVKIAQLVQSVLSSTAGATADTRIILSQLLNPTNGQPPMDVNLNQLLNNAVLQNVIKQLPPELLAKPQIFEAVVLQNTLLPSASANTGPSAPPLPNTLLSNPPLSNQSLLNLPLLIVPKAISTTSAQTPPSNLYRVSVEWQNRIIELISPQPLIAGNRVQLQTTPRGEIVLLAAALAAKAPLSGAGVSAPSQPATRLAIQQQIAQQALREIMPRQQSLTALIPTLQKLFAPAIRQQLPAPIQKALDQLLQSLPKPEQMKTAEGVKRALETSGNFLESRLVRTPNASTESPQRVIATDVKAQISTLLELIRRLVPAATIAPRTTPTVDNDELVYTQKPTAHTSAANNPQPKNEAESIDTLLTQLSKLLQAGLARIQVNQLDSFSARHLDTNTAAPTPTWVLELPLRTPFGADQLQVRVEQRQRKRGQQTRAQWNVQIALDLHDLGKLAATLSIVEKNVSATLWAEREMTHRKVQEQIDYLRAGLESVGVNVTEMRCRLGMPPPRKNPLSQRLVDVHT